MAVGAIGSVNQLSVAQAFREADATQVLPGDFTKIIWATLIGYFAFAELPDAWVFVGAALIFAGVAHVTYLGARRRT
jgi:drug/metabolite transporter (DMT)-like permease